MCQEQDWASERTLCPAVLPSRRRESVQAVERMQEQVKRFEAGVKELQASVR